ncbi:MAG: response regulator [Paracoccaceae bacterium]|nr:response regulator [Paracoccaceae bacterium]
MFDPNDHAQISRAADPLRPLSGLFVLVVEDSRYASEALRLTLLQSGARIRRADSLASARRHLGAYRPNVAIIDLGLPDGSGVDLITELNATTPRIPVLLAISGASEQEDRAKAAGADAFLPKPLPAVTTVQNLILRHLPGGHAPLRAVSPQKGGATLDPLALRNDLTRLRDILRQPDQNTETLDYAEGFLTGLARIADDPALCAAALRFRENPHPGAVPALLTALDCFLSNAETV